MSHEAQQFWSKVANRYDQVVDLQIGSMTRSLVRERLAQESSLGRVAEFGCGTGYFTNALAAIAMHVIATDFSPEMVEVARERVKATNVTFQAEDCHKTSLADESFDTAFMSLLIHFTSPEATLAEMHRILKPGGVLIIVNLDPGALTGFHRLRSIARVAYQGLTGYRVKPPRAFGRGVLSEERLAGLLRNTGFRVAGAETIKDPLRSSNIPLEYVRAVRL